MKKITLVSASMQFTRNALQFLGRLKEEHRMFVVGGFTHALNYQKLIKTSDVFNAEVINDLIERDQETVDENVIFFTDYCRQNNIQCRIFKENFLLAIDNLIMESRFSDLLVVSNVLLKDDGANLKPALNLKHALHSAECPVLVLPQIFGTPARILIAYDGKMESMFALKQFCYLMLQYLDLPAEIVYLDGDEMSKVPQVRLLKEYVKQNFSSVSICKLDMNPQRDFATWVSSKEDALVIAGSYSKKGFLNSVPPSFIDPLFKMQISPVFIAHL